MAGTVFNLKSYRMPSDGIQRNRRVFYGLRRKSDEAICQWLTRVQSYIRHCEFSIFREFLLIDRFICGLNPSELESIQSLNKSWTVKELLKYYADENDDSKHIPVGDTAVIDNDININKNQDNDSESSDEPVILQDDPLECTVNEYDAFKTIEHEFHSAEKTLDGNEDNRETSKRAKRNERKKSNDVSVSTFKNKGPKGNPSKRKRDSKQIYKCDQCEKSYNRLDNLNTHKKSTHQLNSSFVCNLCNKHFATTQNLKKHSAVHSGERPFKCALCNRQFSQLANLDRHKFTIHQPVRPHTCKLCDSQFTAANDLKRHILSHTGEKKFMCHKCGKSYNYTSRLDEHIKKCH